MMNLKETKITASCELLDIDEADRDELCEYASEQIRIYLQTFNQLPRERQGFTHPEYDPYHILIDFFNPIENEIRCYVDFSQT